jgi:putative membrane protein
MTHFLSLVAGTVWLRPYVFAFLGTYLVLATWHLGLGRALVFLVLGYLISWTAEFSSINFGFPFGEYLYIPATTGRELWVAGVPFMDSLSYVFLAYASYTTALVALATAAPWPRPGDRFLLIEEPALAGSWRPLVLGAVFMVALDIVIDPVALRGYRWFLGQIYGYPEGGVYFGIPLSNFAGWFLVALVLIGILQRLVPGPPPARGWGQWGRRRFAFQALLGPALYLGVLGFNLAMTFLIGEAALGWVGVFIYLPFLSWLFLKLWPGRA